MVANAEIGEKGKLFIQFSFSFFHESEPQNQNNYHHGPFFCDSELLRSDPKLPQPLTDSWPRNVAPATQIIREKVLGIAPRDQRLRGVPFRCDVEPMSPWFFKWDSGVVLNVFNLLE
jgi:hypothetical protein